MLEIEVIFSQFFDTELFDKVKFFFIKPGDFHGNVLSSKMNKETLPPPPPQLLYTSPRSYVLL